MVTSYFKLLRNRNFFLLWVGQVISQFGDRLTQMALVGLVYKSAPGSSFGLAKIFSLSIIPVFLISPVAGVYVDRWNKQKTMYSSDFMRGFFLILIPIVYARFDSLAPVYVLIFLSFCVGKMFIPAKMAIIPSLVSAKDLLRANSLISLTSMIAAVLGLGLGGVLVEKWGAQAAFYMNGATFFISALFILFMQINEKASFQVKDILDMGKEAISQVEKSVIFEVKEGLKYILKRPETRYAVNMKIILFGVIGSLYTIFIVFIQNTFSTVTKDLGWLAIGAGVGMFLGTVAYGKFGQRFSPKMTISASLLGAGAWLAGFILILHSYPSKIFAFAACIILGVLCSPLEIAINTLIHQESHNNFLGRIFSSLEVLLHIAFIIFMFLASFLAEKIGAFTVIVFIGIIVMVFGLVQIILRAAFNEATDKK